MSTQGVKKKPIASSTIDRQYKRTPSFIDYLPWVEFLEQEQAVLMEDGRSVGAVFELRATGTDGRLQDYLANIRDRFQEALQDSFDEYDDSPWILQTYTQDELDIDHLVEHVRQYATEEAAGTEYTEAYLEVLAAHYRGVTRPGGLFVDEAVTKAPWGGRVRKNYLVIYRRHVQGKKQAVVSLDRALEVSLEDLNDTVSKFTNALKPTGATLRRLSGQEFHRWMLEFFNQETGLFNGDRRKFLAAVGQHDDSLPVGDRFAESLFYEYPRTDMENQCCWFGETALRSLSTDGIRERPPIGNVTGELKRSDVINAMMDQMPPGCVFVSTVVFIPQDSLENHIDDIERSAIGENSSSAQVRQSCAEAREILGKRHKIYRAKYSVYVRGNDIKTLNKRTGDVRSLLLLYGFDAIAINKDLTALDNVVGNLPMVYDAARDAKEGWRGAQLTLVQHIASNSVLFGRSTGTGNPGIANFNRGGEPVFYDPLNKHDRQNNAHMLVLGPTGSGKSATLVNTLSHVMAVHRPRLFILEVGDSFGLMGDWFKTKGLTVNKVALNPGGGVSLAPYGDAHLLLQVPLLQENIGTEEEGRDILGEMETATLLMITGGEVKERDNISRADRGTIREAILEAAKKSYQEERTTLTEDVRDVLFTLADKEGDDQQTSRKIRDMAKALGLFCSGFAGELFNQPGKPWPECDVTIIDMATLAKEGYEAHLSIAVMGCLNMIDTISERDQYEPREIITVIDEAHIITTNPLLAPYLVKIVKMWRKRGAWLWSATQNMEDYPDEAKKMLNMVEWWLCLVMPMAEVEEISRFKGVDDALRALLLSASKAGGQYTEGVVMSAASENLIRIVPPSLILALAQTEKHEKAARMALMDKHGVSKLEAAMMIGREIDKARGIIE